MASEEKTKGLVVDKLTSLANYPNGQNWNNSAPHGAGRLYSRTQAKDVLTMSEYKKRMQGIYTNCVSTGTLDESPMAYKDAEEIIEAIKPTAEIIDHLKPLYNFKVS